MLVLQLGIIMMKERLTYFTPLLLNLLFVLRVVFILTSLLIFSAEMTYTKLSWQLPQVPLHIRGGCAGIMAATYAGAEAVGK